MSEQEIAGYIVLAVIIAWGYQLFKEGEEDEWSYVWLTIYNR